jgi:hypothetical protein
MHRKVRMTAVMFFCRQDVPPSDGGGFAKALSRGLIES